MKSEFLNVLTPSVKLYVNMLEASTKFLVVESPSFEYDEKFSATISEDGKLRAIKLSDMCLDDYYAIPKDSVAAAFDCSRVIMNETLSEFVTFLEKELANMGLGIS